MRKKRKTQRTRSDTTSKRKKVYKKKAVIKKIRKNAAPKTRNGGKWTESQFWQQIRSALRNRTRFWIPRVKALEAARRPSQSTNKRLKWEFKCCKCGNWFPQTQVQVHHTTEAGALNCAADLPGFVERLFTEIDWAVVCKPCHKKEHEK